MAGRPPGFYPDPLSPAHERWWDGERWGDQARKAVLSSAPAALEPPLLPGAPTPTTGFAAPGYMAPPTPGLGLPPKPGPHTAGVPQAPTGPLPQSWRPAGFWRRLGGYVVDFIVVIGLAQLLLFAINSVLAGPLAVTNYFSHTYLESPDWYVPAVSGLEPLLWLLYRGLLEPTRARTLGQQLFGMRTLSADTLDQVGFRGSLHRHLLTASLLLATVYYPTAALAALAVTVVERLLMLSRRGARQTGHDRLAGTVVEVAR